jgi:hypothetical protein
MIGHVLLTVAAGPVADGEHEVGKTPEKGEAGEGDVGANNTEAECG